MALSTPASSRTSQLLRFLRRPAAFVGSNWAGLLACVSVVGLVPGLAGVMRVVTDLDRHDDEPFVVPLRQVASTWRRDLPVTLLLWVVVVLGGLNTFAIIQVDAGTRVAVVGFLVPVVWAALVFISAYVAATAAQPHGASRHDVLGLAAMIVRQRPVRTWLTPVLLVAMAPVILLPPLTVAVGLSLPGWVLGEWFGVSAWRRRLDPETRTS